MTDLLELVERAPRDAGGTDVAETLVPMLDDLARAFGCDRGLILVYDERRRSLRGVSGFDVRPELVDSIELRLEEERPSVMTAALETRTPQRVDDITRDARLGETTRQVLIEAGFQRTVVVPVNGPTGDPVGAVVLSRKAGFSQGELRALVAITNRARDVVARARDMADLRDTGEQHAIEKEWLYWMVNAVDDPVVVMDETNEIVLRNMRAEALFKANDDDSEGRRHAMWMNNFLFTAALSSWKLEPGASAGREVTLVDPIEGNELAFEVIARTATNYRDGSHGTVAVLKDVTQLRHVGEELLRGRQELQTAGEAIRVERDRLELILRSVPNPIVVLGVEDEPITMNPAALRLFGAERDRPIPVADRGRQIVLANETRFTSFISQMRLEPGTRKQGEIALSDPETEEPLEMSVTASEIRDPKGAVVGLVAVLQDIGRLRELERRRVEQILFDSEKLAATGRLAASIAHELNNPLEAIQNSLYVLVERRPETDPDHPFLEIARKETARMSRILREMLGFYRPALEMAATDLNVLIGEAEALLAKRLRERDVRIEKKLDAHLPPITASADQLKQVLLNLFLNAADAMPEGGMVSVSTTLIGGARIGMPTSRSVQIQVRDNGQGIPPEEIPHIFEPFFSTKGKQGSGLGLWVSSGIVQAHGGALQVRSIVGRGTTFTIVLPVEGPAAKEKEKAS